MYHSRHLEREISICFRGYRYALRDQDTTWPEAYESVHRGYGGKGFIYIQGFPSIRCAAWLDV